MEEGPGPLLPPRPGDARLSRQAAARLAAIRPPLSLQTYSHVGPGVGGPAVVRSPRTCWEVWGGGGGNSRQDSSARPGGSRGLGGASPGEGRGLSGEGTLARRAGAWSWGAVDSAGEGGPWSCRHHLGGKDSPAAPGDGLLVAPACQGRIGWRPHGSLG